MEDEDFKGNNLPRDRLNVDRHPQDAQEISLCRFAAHSALVLCSAKHND